MAWNVNHRARVRHIPEGLAPAILDREPDLVVLTEYVEGRDHEAFTERLADGGLIYPVLTPQASGHNQVLIASRRRISRLDFPAPDTLGHASSNLLMVEVPELNLQVVGLRVPFYLKAGDARFFWDWFEDALEALRDHPVVIMGDFNADPDKPRGRGSSHLARLVNKGWQLPRPEGDWSYRSTTGKTSRVDHVLLAPGLVYGRVEYTMPGSTVFAVDKPVLSDHAALLVELRRSLPKREKQIPPTKSGH